MSSLDPIVLLPRKNHTKYRWKRATASDLFCHRGITIPPFRQTKPEVQESRLGTLAQAKPIASTRKGGASRVQAKACSRITKARKGEWHRVRVLQPEIRGCSGGKGVKVWFPLCKDSHSFLALKTVHFLNIYAAPGEINFSTLNFLHTRRCGR